MNQSIFFEERQANYRHENKKRLNHVYISTAYFQQSVDSCCDKEQIEKKQHGPVWPTIYENNENPENGQHIDRLFKHLPNFKVIISCFPFRMRFGD
jgi:hypothetical protein